MTSVKPSEQTVSGTWFDLIPPEWNRPDAPPVLLKVFTSSFRDKEELARSAFLAAQYIANRPVKIGEVRTETLSEIQGMQLLAVYDPPRMILNGHGYLIGVPAGDYVALMSPIVLTADGMQEIQAAEAIDAVRGFLCATLGPTVVHSLALSALLDPKLPGQVSTVSPPIQTGQLPSEFATLHSDAYERLRDVMLGDLPAHQRARIATAFTFVGRAHNTPDETLRLFDLWTALEVLVGGYSRLAGMIDRRRDKGDWRTSMLRFKERRRQIVHEGAKVRLSNDEQKLLMSTIISEVLTQLDIGDVSGAVDAALRR